jgi:hypothetical protein
MFRTIFAGVFSIAALAIAAAPSQAATLAFSFNDNVDGIFANGDFTVSNTANADGTFDITDVTGAVIDDRSGTPTIDSISLEVPNFNDPSPTDAFGFIYDNVAPLNVNGVLFMGASGDIYNLWSTGGGNGELYTYGAGLPAFDAAGTLSVGGVPEPATWAMMLTGFFGLGSVLRRRRAALAV